MNQHFERALEHGRSVGSRWFMLRGACELVAAADTAVCRASAVATLRDVCAGFTEGFELGPLKRARALLGSGDGVDGR